MDEFQFTIQQICNDYIGIKNDANKSKSYQPCGRVCGESKTEEGEEGGGAEHQDGRLGIKLSSMGHIGTEELNTKTAVWGESCQVWDILGLRS